MRGARLGALPVLGLGCALAACSSPASSCPTQIPPCPSPAPSFVNEVNPIIQSTCVPCHGPGGIESVRPYLTYEDMAAYGPFQTMYQQVLICRMPESPQMLTPDQRQRLLEWFACLEPDDRDSADGGPGDGPTND
jgi:hypothetical protein